MPTTSNPLIESHLSFAEALGREISKELPAWIPFEDLRQAAFLGLTEAASRFNASVGTSFTVFAHPRIRGAVWDAVRRMRDVPPQLRTRARRQAAFAAATEDLGSLLDKAAGSTPLTESLLRGAIDTAGTISLLSDLACPSRGEGDTQRFDAPCDREGPSAELEREDARIAVRKAVAALPPKVRRVVEAIAFDGRRQVDLARERGCDKATINRLWKAGLQQLQPVLVRALGATCQPTAC